MHSVLPFQTPQSSVDIRSRTSLAPFFLNGNPQRSEAKFQKNKVRLPAMLPTDLQPLPDGLMTASTIASFAGGHLVFHPAGAPFRFGNQVLGGSRYFVPVEVTSTPHAQRSISFEDQRHAPSTVQGPLVSGRHAFWGQSHSKRLSRRRSRPQLAGCLVPRECSRRTAMHVGHTLTTSTPHHPVARSIENKSMCHGRKGVPPGETGTHLPPALRCPPHALRLHHRFRGQ